MEKRGFNTRLLHSDYAKDDVHNALQMPLYGNSAFEFDSAEDIEASFKGTKPAHAYSRSSNPTVENLELRLKYLTEATSVTAFASGMAAITGLIITLCKAGDNIITSNRLFGNTLSLFESTLKPFGLEFRYADFLDPNSIQPLIDSNTRLIFLETINNPQLEVPDIQVISEIAKRNKILLAADTTLTPPCVFDAGKNGLDISVFSSTKYVSSGGATVGGIIIDHGSYKWDLNPKLAPYYKQFGKLTFLSRLRKDIFRNTGGCMSPFNAYLQTLGLETMVLRYNQMSKNALEVATWLEKHPKVKSVNYPGLTSSPYYEVCKKQLTGLPGGLLTFDLFSKDACFKFMNELKLIKRATNLNDNKTLIIHPASTIYSEFPAELIKDLDVRDTLIRLSVGIEDAEDLLQDMENALGYL